MEIDQVCSRETQTLSTAASLQWRYDLCNRMIKVANLFGTSFSAVARLFAGRWCERLNLSIGSVCIYRRNVRLGTFCWHSPVSICMMVQRPPSRFVLLSFDSPRLALMFTSCETDACFVIEMNSVSTWRFQAGEMPLRIIDILLSKKIVHVALQIVLHTARSSANQVCVMKIKSFLPLKACQKCTTAH